MHISLSLDGSDWLSFISFLLSNNHFVELHCISSSTPPILLFHLFIEVACLSMVPVSSIHRFTDLCNEVKILPEPGCALGQSLLLGENFLCAG